MSKINLLYLIKLFALAVISLISSCSSTDKPVEQRNYLILASDAEDNRLYQKAKHYYQQALNQAQDTNPNSNEVSATLYNLGRMHGYLCDFKQAETLLLQALSLENKLSGPYSETSSMNTLELARLYYDQQKYKQALPLYKKGIIILEKLQAEIADPIALAEILEEYAITLNAGKATAEAKAAQSRANKLRQAQSEGIASFRPHRYNKNCGS